MAKRKNVPLRPAVRQRAVEALEVERLVACGLRETGYDGFTAGGEVTHQRIKALEWVLGEREDG